ncbi:MAG: tetratricopeptide repeat protein [Planctomycetaceae bacterium]|nr:tetratricopeptide repeat protein [Planctomycetaceae bacterium]
MISLKDVTLPNNGSPVNELSSPPRRIPGRSWLYRTLLILAATVVLAGGIYGVLRWQQATSLTTARRDLRRLAAAGSADRRLELARHATRELDWNRQLGGRSSGGTLLRYVCSVLTAEGGVLPAFPADLKLSRVETDDLLLAATSFLGVRQLGLADPLVREAYTRPDHRLRTLELATSVEYELGNMDFVLECCDEWQQLDPNASAPWLVAVFVYENRGKLQLVIEPLKEAIRRLPPPAVTYRTQLIDYLLQLRQTGEARQQFNALRGIAPETISGPSLTETRLLLAEGATSRALDMANQLMASKPDDPAVLLLVGKIHLTMQKPADALPILSSLVARYPFEPEAQFLLGQTLARLQRRAESKVHLDKHRAIIRAKTDIHKLQRQAALEPDNLALRLDLVKRCDEVQWTEQAAHWRQAVEALRAAQAAHISKP